ncbi:MAG: [LysW]-lysine hydrolase [Anaerolineae bacterium]
MTVPLSDADAMDLLEGLVRIESYSTQEEAAVRWLVERMAALGMRAERDAAGNAVGVIGDGPRQVVLLGHIDTVPGVVPVRRENGALYGRGSVDAKGPLAAFVCAAARAAVPDGWQVVVVGAVEEEWATSKGAHFAATGYRPQWCIIGEPSGWDRVTLGYKGRLLAHYSLRQPGAHSAGQTPSAAEQAVAFWNQVAAVCAEMSAAEARAFDQVTPGLRSINTGSDGLYETAEMVIGFRLPPAVSPHAVEARVAALAGLAEVRFTGHETAYRAEKNTEVARAFLRAIRAEGGMPAFKVKTGTSDMNVVAPVWQCPIVAYGPGDSALDHTPHEHVPIEDFHRAVRVLTDVLSALPTDA